MVITRRASHNDSNSRIGGSRRVMHVSNERSFNVRHGNSGHGSCQLPIEIQLERVRSVRLRFRGGLEKRCLRREHRRAS